MATIDLEVTAPFLRGHVAVAVRDAELNTVQEHSVQVGDSYRISVEDAGQYHVETTLPSGRRLTRTVRLGPEGQVPVRFDLGGLGRAETQTWAGVTHRDARQERPFGDRAESVWLRLWSRKPGEASNVIAWELQEAERQPGAIQYRLPVNRWAGSDRQVFLQVGGPKMAWRLYALPPYRLKVLVTANSDGAKDPVDVRVTTEDGVSAMLLGYLHHGAMVEARTIADAHAKELLRQKGFDPNAAAVAGYFMLRTGALEQVRHWAFNLAQGFEAMADGAVIWAWALIQYERKPEEARKFLLEAERRGLPLYTDGLRLLRDGLRRFAKTDDGQPDVEVQAARERLRPYLQTVDWERPITTFTGFSPERPSRARGGALRGLPDSPEHVVFLDDVTLADLRWKGLVPTPIESADDDEPDLDLAGDDNGDNGDNGDDNGHDAITLAELGSTASKSIGPSVDLDFDEPDKSAAGGGDSEPGETPSASRPERRRAFRKPPPRPAPPNIDLDRARRIARGEERP